jgi:hypothetical protein
MHLPACWRSVVSGATVALAAVALTASPASAASGAPAGCPDVPTAHPFALWQDQADYLLAPDGDLEAGAAGWTLVGGARAVEGNETFAVGGPADHRSLRLPAGASASTAPMCIGAEHRTMRFFAMSTGRGTLAVEALYTKHNGVQKSVALGAVRGGDAWAPTDALPMRVNELAGDYANAMSVSLRFTVRGNATWQVDDVYVDPFRMK